MRWPGKIPAGTVCDEPAMTIDILPTVAKLTGTKLPAHGVDGKDIWPLMSGQPGAKSPHDAYYFYYRRNELQAILSGRWKLHLPHGYRTMDGRPGGTNGRPNPYTNKRTGLELYDLVSDVHEKKDLAKEKPDVVERLLGYAERAREDLGDSLTKKAGKNLRPAGRLP